jgi:hypothetical protein
MGSEAKGALRPHELRGFDFDEDLSDIEEVRYKLFFGGIFWGHFWETNGGIKAHVILFGNYNYRGFCIVTEEWCVYSNIATMICNPTIDPKIGSIRIVVKWPLGAEERRQTNQEVGIGGKLTPVPCAVRELVYIRRQLRVVSRRPEGAIAGYDFVEHNVCLRSNRRWLLCLSLWPSLPRI